MLKIQNIWDGDSRVELKLKVRKIGSRYGLLTI